MVLKHLLLFSLISFYAGAQSGVNTFKVKKDTIDYSWLVSRFDSYQLEKISNRSFAVPYPCHNEIWFRSPVDDFFYKDHGIWRSPLLLKNDTLINMEWYMLKNERCLCSENQCDLWKLKLNQRSNVMVVKRVTFRQATRPDMLLLKVIKFTQYEIVLQDLQPYSHERLYFFRKK